MENVTLNRGRKNYNKRDLTRKKVKKKKKKSRAIPQSQDHNGPIGRFLTGTMDGCTSFFLGRGKGGWVGGGGKVWTGLYVSNVKILTLTNKVVTITLAKGV